MKFNNNQPFIRKGLEVSQISFSGGRVAASIANHGGITHINYYGRQRFADVVLFRADPISAWSHLFRPGVYIDGKMYMFEFNDTLIYPFGYTSYCALAGVKFKHGLYLLNDALVFTLDIISNPVHKTVTFVLINTATTTRSNKSTRTWDQMKMIDDVNAGITSIIDKYPPETVKLEKEQAKHTLAQAGSYYNPPVAKSKIWMGMTAKSILEFKENPSVEGLHKHYFSSECTGAENFISLVFGHGSREELLQRFIQLQETATAESSQLINQYNLKMSQPEIHVKNKTVQSLLMNTGPILDSMKVADITGGMRAADSGYWIWGWDTMVHAEAFGLANDSSYLQEILEFYRKTADPKWGIFHEMHLDQRPCLSMAFPAQCLYAITLYFAYIFSGDKKLLKEYFPFAEWIVKKAGEEEVRNSGLIKGVALYPDHPEDLEQDGHDLSSFNNSIYYQALKVMEELALEIGDKQLAAEFQTRAKRACSGFQLFYDQDKHYFYDSISAVDFSPRRHYPVYAILWLTPFAQDLVSEHKKEIAGFMKKNFVANHGLRLLPVWDTRFMYDGNQLGMYMPVVENFFREIMRIAGLKGSVKSLYKNIEWFWQKLCIPEALTCEYENHGITPDNPGRKQAFCAKAWLNAFYHSAVGLQLTCRGISFAASEAGNISISKLKIRNKILDIDICGKGSDIRSLQLNGKNILAPFIIPFTMLKSFNKIFIEKK